MSYFNYFFRHSVPLDFGINFGLGGLMKITTHFEKLYSLKKKCVNIGDINALKHKILQGLMEKLDSFKHNK